MTVTAHRPPRGWNSWDCFGTSVTEDEVRANAEVMAERLLPHGWDTVTVDIQWYEPDARAGGYLPVSTPVLDRWGRQLPAPGRFPSAAGGAGFAPLAAWVHDRGLRFGLHVMRGIPRLAVEQNLPIAGAGATAADIADADAACTWNPDNLGIDLSHPAGQAWYDAQVAQFAQWGVDFLKLDDVLYPYRAADIEAYATAIDRCGRDIELSLSPGRHLSSARLPHLREHATMWRVSDDLWDRWDDVHEQFQRAARWASLPTSPGWADLDMLPLGRIGIRAERGTDRQSALTHEEQRTMLTLWCIARSPLILGGHLPDTPDETLALLTNPDVLAVQEAATSAEIVRDGDLVVWRAEAPGVRWIAVFWLGDTDAESVRVRAGDVGLPAGARGVDCWSDDPVSLDDHTWTLTIAAHGARLFRFTEDVTP